MNTRLGIFGAVAGFISAVFLTTGMPSLGGVFKSGCFTRPDAANVTRTLPWNGDHSVAIMVPATVLFKAEPEWRVVVTGPPAVLEHLQFSNGRFDFDQRMNLCDADLKISLTGPAVQQWTLAGSGRLSLEQLHQADLDITVAGSGSAAATGTVERTRATIRGSGDLNLNGLLQTDVDLDIKGSGSATADGTAARTRISISGSGDARLGRLVVKDASVRISGSGNADIAPENSAEIRIQGSGNVRLLKQPGTVQKWIQGSGKIVDAT